MTGAKNGDGAGETRSEQTDAQRKGGGEGGTGGSHDAHRGESKNVHLPEGEELRVTAAVGGAPEEGSDEISGGGGGRLVNACVWNAAANQRRRRRARAQRHPHSAPATAQLARSTPFFTINLTFALSSVKTKSRLQPLLYWTADTK